MTAAASVPRDPTGETVYLSAGGAEALALRVVAKQVKNADEWLLWENLPLLSEDSFELLTAAVERVADDLMRRSRAHDQMCRVDSADIESRAS